MFFTNSLVNDLLNIENNYSSPLSRGVKSVTYYTDSSESEQTITLAVPGFQKSDIKMNTSTSSRSHSVLNISSSISEDRIAENPFLFNFKTKFHIARGYNADSIKANMQDGILTITVPKCEVVDLNRTIQID